MPTNNFLPFCPTDTGSNLLNDSDYSASTGRTAGNVPGVASSKLNNKALRQASYIAATVAQLVANQTGTDILDDATPAKFLAQATAALTGLAPVTTVHASGSGTHQLTYFFFTASANATTGATYTNNGQTFTVVGTIAAGALLRVTGTGAPTLSGTLTKSAGTGDATIAFYAVRAPKEIDVEMVGGGGGGSGAGTTAGGTGVTGGATTFGTLTANGGAGGVSINNGGAGGSASLGGANGLAFAGAAGGGYTRATGADYVDGAAGGSTPFGGAGATCQPAAVGLPAVANTGSGGGGGSSASASHGGSGGGAGGWLKAFIPNPTGTYAWSVGGGGAGGTLGGSGYAGGSGGAGVIMTREIF